MIDYINYYYDLYPDVINKIDDNYMFYVNLEKYYFIVYDRFIEELDEIVDLNKKMIENGSMVSEIITNKYDKVINNYNNKIYILLRVYVNDTKKVDIQDIIYMLNEVNVDKTYKLITRTNWAKLWEDKVDYFEYQMGHIIKKYRLLYNTIDYYIGMSENAIFYLKNIVSSYEGKISIGISHKRIGVSSTLFDLYNPLNLIIDYKIRDISLYIKDAFFNDKDLNNILKCIYSNFYFDKLNLSLMFSRLLFPSYFYDSFEQIVYNGENENIMYDLIKKSSSYEEFLDYFIKTCNLQSIDWLNKN